MRSKQTYLAIQTYGTIHIGDDIKLKKGRIHEVTGDARASFAGVVAKKISASVIWIGRKKTIRSIHPTALEKFMNPGQIITVTCLSRKEVLWASEQALKSQGANLVISEMELGPNLTESRRLQLAAEQGVSTGLVLISRNAQTSSAQTRWDCYPILKNPADNMPQWHWLLTKNKAGSTGSWQVKWKGNSHAPDYVRLVTTTAA